MKKHLLLITAFTFAVTLGRAQEIIRCATTEYTQMEEQLDPSIKKARAIIEEQTRAYIENQKNNPTPVTNTVVTIPIVFHIVYNNAAENVSDACIAATLKSLNDDFRKLNADFTTKTPAVFQSLGADCEIQFCMATKDPTGAATNGITRTSSTHGPFSTNNDVKYTSKGGHDVWDSKKYVNLWVCNFAGSLLGYGQFPGGSAATDGVVCHVKYLHKNGGCGATPFELGRTTVHELGHFFNLKHINGDSNCGDDGVADTPKQDQLHFGCPTHPLHANNCSGSTNGEMFMNYMDYVDDKCMVMFTLGQKTRMQAALSGPRSGLLTSAATLCSAGSGTYDLSLSDHISIYPNPSSTGEVFITTELSNINTMDLKVYNAIGEMVLSKKVTVSSSRDIKLDMSSSPDGIYLFQVKTSEGTLTKKVVISR